MTFCFETFFGDFPGKKNLSGKIIWRNDLERCQNINMFIQCCFLAQQLAEYCFTITKCSEICILDENRFC